MSDQTLAETRARLRALLAERDTYDAAIERDFHAPQRAGREPVYEWWKHEENLEDVEDKIKDAAHNALPALLDAMDEMEAERDALRAALQYIAVHIDEVYCGDDEGCHCFELHNVRDMAEAALKQPAPDG